MCWYIGRALLVAIKFLTAKLHSLYVKESESGNFGKFGHFASDSSTHVEIVQFFLKFLWKLIILVVYHDFHWLLVATKLLTAKLYSCYAKESESRVGNFGMAGVRNFEKVGVGNFGANISPLTPQPCLSFGHSSLFCCCYLQNYWSCLHQCTHMLHAVHKQQCH